MKFRIVEEPANYFTIEYKRPLQWWWTKYKVYTFIKNSGPIVWLFQSFDEALDAVLDLKRRSKDGKIQPNVVWTE